MSKKTLVLLLFLWPLTGFSAKIDSLTVWSASMHKSVKNIAILPKTYSASKQRFPVIYMLHGAGDDYRGWLEIAPEITRYADLYNVILICPDGGNSSWYFDSPVDPTYRYETYITKELISMVDIKYRTVSNKSGRGITGLSMGGHGAFFLAFRHTNLFGAAASMSGGLDIRPFAEKWDLSKRLGPINQYPQTWEKYTVINLVPSIQNKQLKLLFDCGRDDFFYSVNLQVHQKMQELKIAHEFLAKSGGHTLVYWRSSVKNHIEFFNEFFRKPAIVETPGE